jgi:hypothetical protein
MWTTYPKFFDCCYALNARTKTSVHLTFNGACSRRWSCSTKTKRIPSSWGGAHEPSASSPSCSHRTKCNGPSCPGSTGYDKSGGICGDNAHPPRLCACQSAHCTSPCTRNPPCHTSCGRYDPRDNSYCRRTCLYIQ